MKEDRIINVIARPSGRSNLIRLGLLRRLQAPRNDIYSLHAFSLMELIVVVVIIGVLASAAIPSYATHIERVRASEGVQSLLALLSSQKSYQLENSTYATTLASLDIDIAASNNFAVPTVANNAAAVASIARRNGPVYTLSISSTGVVSCAPAGADCTRIGY